VSTELVGVPAAIREAAAFPSAADRDFYTRIFSTPADVYVERLRAVGFEGHGRVLDAACGFGQWSLALAELNRRVDAFDVQQFRADVVRRLVDASPSVDVGVARASLDAMPYADGTFDAAFCYGAAFFVDFRLALSELHRVLRPAGLLYVSANGLGWYLYNLIENHKPSADYSPRRMAAKALVASGRSYLGRPVDAGEQRMIPRRSAVAALRGLGFDDVRAGGDGQLGTGTGRSFFPATKYGLTNVYEVLGRKR
jgi:SAM-dependent methyltransferase